MSHRCAIMRDVRDPGAGGSLLPAGTPPLLTIAVVTATGWLLGAVVWHVVSTLLHDWRQAAWRELEGELEEARRRLDGGSDGATT